MWKKIWGFFKWVFTWLYIWVYAMIFRISFALFKVEEEIMKASVDDLDEKNKYNIRMKHTNPLVEKLIQGQRDSQFMADFYEILKKADAFMRNSTPEQIEMAAGKWGMSSYGKSDEELQNVGKKPKKVRRDAHGKIIRKTNSGKKRKSRKDKFGRRHEHYGFFDPKSKNYGKTMAQVMKGEVLQRVTNDDQYPVEFMFSNKPKDEGIRTKEVFSSGTNKSDTGFEVKNELQKTKDRKFPMIVVRDNEDALNKIERLTEYLHVKETSSKHRILEFFIPSKYKTSEIKEDDEVFKELIDIKQVWIADEYGDKYGFSVKSYRKRVIQEIDITEDGDKVKVPIYEVIKLNGEKIENIM